MDTSQVMRKREFGLVREADKVRTVLIVFCAFFLFATPAVPGARIDLAWTGLCLAAFATLLTRFFVDWDRLCARGAVPIAATMVLIADLAWLMMFVAGTGGFASPFNMLLLILILFAGVFFGSLPLALPLTTAIVVAWYAGAAAASSVELRDAWTLAAQIISAVAVGWLGWALAGVLERERRTNAHIVGNLTEGVLLLNEAGKVVLANPRVGELLGCGEEQVLGRSALSAGAPAELRAVLAGVQVSAEGAELTPRLVELGEDSTRDLRVSTVPYPPGVRRPQGWVVVLEDVTDLRAAARMKEEGLAIVSHELRSPLATLGALSQVLERLGEQMDEEQKAQAVAALSDETRRLGRMVSTLLDAGHLERGAYTLAPELVDPGALMRRVGDFLRRQAGGRNLRVVCAVDPDLPSLWADPTRLELVLSNLGDNALKYTPDGGEVRLAAHRSGTQVSLIVSDTGPGIPSHEQAAIFEKYSRGPRHRATQGRQEGLGLGLYVARRIVELHGGELRVESHPGDGSSFEVLLPAAASEQLKLRPAA
jgi:PAS domain S-box-containing protein